MNQYNNGAIKVGLSDEWYTPPVIFKALGVKFNLDPCSPSSAHWVPAKHVFTKEDDGLSKRWVGSVFMNPPFGGRNGVVPWLSKFVSHGCGICIVPAYTSAGWFHQYAPHCHAMLFPKGKTRFVDAGGKLGRCPINGVVLLACGEKFVRALQRSQLGIFVEIKK